MSKPNTTNNKLNTNIIQKYKKRRIIIMLIKITSATQSLPQLLRRDTGLGATST